MQIFWNSVDIFTVNKLFIYLKKKNLDFDKTDGVWKVNDMLLN